MGNDQGAVSQPRELTSVKSESRELRKRGGSHTAVLRFNAKAHARTVRLSHDSTRAHRHRGSAGVCFSRRPVGADELIYIRVAEVASDAGGASDGAFTFGLTKSDPASLSPEDLNDFTDYADYGRCMRPVPEQQRGNVLAFYRAPAGGAIMYGVNGRECGVFLSLAGGAGGGADGGGGGVGSIWIVVDLCGGAVAVEFLDGSQLCQIYRMPSTPSLTLTESPLTLGHQALRIPSLATAPSPPKPIPSNSGAGLQSMPFHARLYGRNISLSSDKLLATRRGNEYCHGYVFTDRCLHPGERLTISVVKVTPEFNGGLAFGMTACAPGDVARDELPEDSDLLLNRPEYWVVHKDVCSSPEKGDLLAFQLSLEGEVRYMRNGHMVGSLMFVDHTLPLWAFFDIYGSTSSIQSRGVIRVEQPSSYAALPEPTTPVGYDPVTCGDLLGDYQHVDEASRGRSSAHRVERTHHLIPHAIMSPQSIPTHRAAAMSSQDTRREATHHVVPQNSAWPHLASAPTRTTNAPVVRPASLHGSVPGVTLFPALSTPESPPFGVTSEQQTRPRHHGRSSDHARSTDPSRPAQASPVDQLEQQLVEQFRARTEVSRMEVSGTSHRRPTPQAGGETARHLEPAPLAAPRTGESQSSSRQCVQVPSQSTSMPGHAMHYRSTQALSRSVPQSVTPMVPRPTAQSVSSLQSNSQLQLVPLDSPLDAFIDFSTATLPPPLIPVPAAAPPKLLPPPKTLLPPSIPPRRSTQQPPLPLRKGESAAGRPAGGGASAVGGGVNVGGGEVSVGGVGSRQEGEVGGAECSVCMERAPDCVLYTCGHMCMCCDCAMDVAARSGDCPICREPIRDIIKIFRS